MTSPTTDRKNEHSIISQLKVLLTFKSFHSKIDAESLRPLPIIVIIH